MAVREVAPSYRAKALARKSGASVAVKQCAAMEGEYSGHVKEGKMHGVGVCVYTDGSRYQAREPLPPPRR